MMITENSDPKISLANAYTSVVDHGPIISVIHRIHPDNTHSTLLFCHDGYCHTCTGLACGVNGEASIALKIILQMIPSGAMVVEGEFVIYLGTESKAKQANTEGETLHYIFRGVNRKVGFSLPADSYGMKAVNKVVSRISDDGEYAIEMLDTLKVKI